MLATPPTSVSRCGPGRPGAVHPALRGIHLGTQSNGPARTELRRPRRTFEAHGTIAS
ncbi:hypothetical protein GS506_03480 [Rhodococcus hoagii]|nr:hypothetical protein [Prescottella equi]